MLVNVLLLVERKTYQIAQHSLLQLKTSQPTPHLSHVPFKILEIVFPFQKIILEATKASKQKQSKQN